MKNLRSIILIPLLLWLVFSGYGQENVLTVGVQFKPIIPSNLFNTGKQEIKDKGVELQLKPKFGTAFGMVIRKGVTETVSFETGINFVSRNYDLNVNDVDSALNETSDFKFISYEMPLLALVYVQLGDELFMNAAGGASLDFFPSDIFTSDTYFRHSTIRRNWVQTGLLANVGFEYRTRKSGYFYIGASFHRPFNTIAFTGIDYIHNNLERQFFHTELNGNYLTLDLRYFFHEDPDKKQKRRR